MVFGPDLRAAVRPEISIAGPRGSPITHRGGRDAKSFFKRSRTSGSPGAGTEPPLPGSTNPWDLAHSRMYAARSPSFNRDRSGVNAVKLRAFRMICCSDNIRSVVVLSSSHCTNFAVGLE